MGRRFGPAARVAGVQGAGQQQRSARFSNGGKDGDATLDEVVEHAGAVDRATELPLSVDLENGYGPEPEDAARAIERVAAAGAVGGSIEDYDPSGRIYDFLAEILAAGAQRVSVGSGLAWTAYESMAVAAEAMRDRADLSGLLAPSRIAKLPQG